MENILRELEIPDVEQVIEKFRNDNITLESALKLKPEDLQSLGIMLIRDQYTMKAKIHKYLAEHPYDGTTRRSTPQSVAAVMTNLFRSRSAGGGRSGGSMGTSSRKRKHTAGAVMKLKFVCLAEREQECRPNTKQKETLLLAGLGDKQLEVPRESSPQELQQIIIEAFPKLKNAGGFQYMRNPANSGILREIVPSPEGYTSSHLKKMIGAGRIFLRPIQVDLDLSPEETAEIEPQNEVMELCFTCSQMIAVNKLKQHIDEHNNNNSEPSNDRPSTSRPGPSTSHPGPSTSQPGPSTSQLGLETSERQLASSLEHEEHGDGDLIDPKLNNSNTPEMARRSTPIASPPIAASQRIDRYMDDYINLIEDNVVSSDEDDAELQTVLAESLNDATNTSETVLEARRQELLSQFQTCILEEQLDLVIRRRRLVKSASEAIRSQSGFSFLKQPIIHFSGEEALDYGGPRREFFRLATQQLPQLGIFEGPPRKLYFTHDIGLLEKGTYQLAGQITAWSVLHGGPGFPNLHTTLYSLMCGRTDGEKLRIDDVTDADVHQHLHATPGTVGTYVSNKREYVRELLPNTNLTPPRQEEQWERIAERGVRKIIDNVFGR